MKSITGILGIRKLIGNQTFRSYQQFMRKQNYSDSSSRSIPKVNEYLIVDKIGPVTTLGINRPEKRNCVNSFVAQELSEAISNFENDSTASVGILYGIGGNFCAGFDLGQLSLTEDAVRFETEKGLGPMGPSRRFIKKPMIAAVSGYAVAGGLELALMCDLRVVEDTAIMGVFCRRFGVPLIDGGTVRLQALIGLSRALDLIITGRPIAAKEALEFGLANRVVACGTALGQAINLAKSLTKFPQECLRADRESAYYSAFSATSYEDGFKFENDTGIKIITQESVQGAQRFVSGVGRHGKFHNLSDDSTEKSKL